MNRQILTTAFTAIRTITGNNQSLLLGLHHVKNLFFNRPRTLMIHPSYKCSFACPYCYVHEKKSENECLPLPRWIELIKEFKKIGGYSVDFLGGEPLEYEHFHELSHFIIQQKLLLNIFTNGENINHELLQHLHPFNKQIIFVVKFDSEHCYQKYYQRPLSNILEKIELLKKYQFTTMAFIVATGENANDVDQIFENCRKHGVYPIFERFAPVKSEEDNQSLSLSAIQWNKILQKSEEYWKKHAKIVKSYSIINGSTCSCSSNNFAVMQNGDARPCPEAHPDLNYGNVAKKSILDIWQKSRKKRKELLQIPDACAMCSNKLMCRGGCKIYSYQKTGSIHVRDPLCTKLTSTTYPHCAFSIIRLLK